MRQDFSRLAGHAQVWLDELPEWARVEPVGVVDGHWAWRHDEPPPSAGRRMAAWGYRVGLGGMDACGVLGARFEPREHRDLWVRVAATTGTGPRAPKPFDAATVGLPHEYVGGVLAGALQDADLVGPGILTFEWAAVHEVDSSWEVFRILAIGVLRLLHLPPGSAVPDDLLPHFGAPRPRSHVDGPASPGAAHPDGPLAR